MGKFKPTISAPVDHVDGWAILDYNAVVRHAHGMGSDPDAVYGSVTGREINTAEHTVRAFIDAYLVPILDSGFSPRQILVAHDDGHDYRSKVCPSYKEKRDKRKSDPDKTDPEIFEQLKKADDSIKRLLAYIGCTQAKVKGVEGDDIVAYFNQLPGTKEIFTVDADMLRLVSDTTIVHMKNKPVYLGDIDLDSLPKNMIGFYTPFLNDDGELPDWNVFELLTLYKSLVGDSSDEYKGVTNFGDKAWADAVKEFERDGLETLSEIVRTKNWTELKDALDHYLSVSPTGTEAKLLSKIHEHRNSWRTCWVVADLHPELCWKPYNKQMTKIDWFKRVLNREGVMRVLEKSCALDYLEDFEPHMPVEWLIHGGNFEEGDVKEFGELCAQSPHVSYDYEGFTEHPDFVKDLLSNTAMKSYVDVYGQKITGVSFNFGANLQYTCYLTVNHKEERGEDGKITNLPMGVIRDFFEAIPEDKIKVAHNSVFEEVLTETNLDGYALPVGTVHDTAVMSVYVDENRESHGLKALSLGLLGYKQASYEDTLADAGASNMAELTPTQVLKYGLDDATVTGSIYDLMKLDLMLQSTWEFYRDNEPYVNHRFAKSFVTGTDMDYEILKEISDEDSADIKENMAELRDVLTEYCSRPNREGADQYFNAEKKFLETSTRKKLTDLTPEKVLAKADSVADIIEKMDIADETMLEIAQRIRMKIPMAKGPKAKEARDLSDVDHKPMIAWVVKYEMHKTYKKCLADSVYVPYKEIYIPPSFAPSVKNLDAVAEKVGLPLPGTAAKGKLDAWEIEVREVDFESETDKFDTFTPEQKEFITLLGEAKTHFKPDSRGHDDYVAFQTFCCKTLGLEGKESYTGTELNLGSPNQVKALMYCMLGLPIHLRGMASASRKDLGFWEGAPATDSLARDTALAEDIVGNPDRAWQEQVINLIKKVVECTTRHSLYHTPYPWLKHPIDGKVHPGLRNCGTVTKRPTGSAPNILQVSKHQKKGAMRGVYIPPRGYAVVPIDFAGQELRIQASETQDPNLLSVYLGSSLTKEYLASVEAGEPIKITYDMVKDKTDLKDLHSLTAFGITEHFGLDEAGELVAGGQHIKWIPDSYEDYVEAHGDESHKYHSFAAKVRKRPAKQTNFLLSYGGTEQTLSHRLIIPEVSAKGIMDSTLTLYSGIPTAQAATLKFARDNGFSQTAYGTRRHASDEIFSKSKGPVNRQVRQLYNSRIQGCAADILKVVLAQCEQTDIWGRYDAIMLAPVYDEVVAYVPFEHCWDFVQDLRKIMNLTPPGHAVPMVADVSVGPNWRIQHELGHQPTREVFDKCMNEEVIPVANAIWDRIDSK